jgi:acyl CoA:acetate/3-ketoacid CoA transferase
MAGWKRCQAGPLHGGSECNARATEDLVERVTFDGKPYPRYKPFRIDAGMVRGPMCDPCPRWTSSISTAAAWTWPS